MKHEINLHTRAIKVLHEIETTKDLIKVLEDNISGAMGKKFPGLIPETEKDIKKLCKRIEKFEETYSYILKELK